MAATWTRGENNGARVQNLSDVRAGTGKTRSCLSLDQLVPSADFVLELAIEQCLVAQFNSAKELTAAIQEEELVPNDRIRRVLLRVNDFSQNERAFDALSAGLA
jgi:hypothetical protein